MPADAGPPLGSADLARLRALCEAATPGPWTNEALNGGPCRTVRRQGDTSYSGVIDLSEKNGELKPGSIGRGGSLDDAAFIAAARTALPALLDLVGRLRAELAAEKDCTTLLADRTLRSLQAEVRQLRGALQGAEAVLIRAAAMTADLVAPTTLEHDLAAALPPVRAALAGLGQPEPPERG